MVRIKIDLSGLKKLQKKLEQAAKPEKVKAVDLLNSSFMSKHSRFRGFEDFLSQCGVAADAFAQMSTSEKDDLVRKNTRFTTWQEMLKAAGVERLRKKLF